jgi:hypothetical protein
MITGSQISLPRRRKHWLNDLARKRLTLQTMLSWRTAAGFALALLVFEAGLRQLQWGHEMLDPRLGWVWRSETVVHRLNEGWGVSHWREDGTRVHAARNANAPRVLIAGDSFTEALQVGDEDVFSGRLTNVDALNVGRSAHSAADYVAFAPEYQRHYSPAWTVIEVGPSDFAQDAFNSSKTHFDDQLNAIVVQPRFGTISARLMTVRRHVDLLDYGIARWQAYRAAAAMPPIFRAADQDQPRVTASPAQPPRTWPVAAEMQLLRRVWNGRITFLFIPSFDDKPGEVEQAFMRECGDAAVGCVNLRSAFDDFRRRGDAPSGFANSRFGEGHLNARGHAAAARLLQPEIERLRARGLF